MAGFQLDTAGTLTTNLVSWWNLDGNSTDDKGGYNGTDTSITYSTGNGKISQGAGFNGTSSKITTANIPGLTSAISVSAWIKLTSGATGDNWVVGKDDATLGRAFCVGVDNANGTRKMHMQINGWPAGIVGATNASAVRGSTTLAVDTWYHCVWIFNDTGNVRKYYLNGVSDNSGTNADATIPATTALVALGQRTYSTVEGFFNGAIDLVGIWSKELSTTEISDLYNSGSGNAYVAAAPSNSNLTLLGVG